MMTQEPPGRILAPQVFVSAKLKKFWPPTETPEIFSVPTPVFVTVRVWVGLVVPTCCAEKVSDEGEMEIVVVSGAVAVPLIATL